MASVYGQLCNFQKILALILYMFFFVFPFKILVGPNGFALCSIGFVALFLHPLNWNIVFISTNFLGRTGLTQVLLALWPVAKRF